LLTDLDGVLVLPLVSDDVEAIRIVGDEELLSNVVEASVDSLKDDSLRRSMFLVVAKDGKRTKDPHLDEIIKLLPFGVGTCSFGFHMSLEPETTKGMILAIEYDGEGGGGVSSTAIGADWIED
ncbi:hypothetical protein Tco_1472541, partial [Tanacetum coccineum]